ncbi:MAG TPA: hypothetical protein DCL99_00675, partial [Firmicutes bacterium]|nr:hypothetical protein [Bacillota bacterium]
MGPRSDRALLMNTVQTVPYYSDHWRELAGELLFFDPRGIDWERDRIHGLQLRRGVGGGAPFHHRRGPRKKGGEVERVRRTHN